MAVAVAAGLLGAPAPSSAQEETTSGPDWFSGRFNVGANWVSQVDEAVSPGVGLFLLTPAHTPWSFMGRVQTRLTIKRDWEVNAVISEVGVTRSLRRETRGMLTAGILDGRDFLALGGQMTTPEVEEWPGRSPRFGFDARVGIYTDGGFMGWLGFFLAQPFG